VDIRLHAKKGKGKREVINKKIEVLKESQKEKINSNADYKK
jgi:hypothetical protein